MTEKFSRYDSADYIKTDEDMALYFATCLEENDPALITHALGVIARAKGMTQLARDTGLSRESLYKSLSGERAPSSDTLFKVLKALGFKLTVAPSAGGEKAVRPKAA